MRLTQEQADRHIRETLRGRFALYDTARDEPVRPDDFRAPDFRPLIQVAQTEQGKSEVSCVIEYDYLDFKRARPMIFTDEPRPSHFAFVKQVGVQADDDASDATSTPDELRRTIDSHLRLTNLEVSAGITPTMSLNARLPRRRPHPDGPTRLTMSLLSDAQSQLDRAHVQPGGITFHATRAPQSHVACRIEHLPLLLHQHQFHLRRNRLLSQKLLVLT